jgi:hypothetical protein
VIPVFRNPSKRVDLARQAAERVVLELDDPIPGKAEHGEVSRFGVLEPVLAPVEVPTVGDLKVLVPLLVSLAAKGIFCPALARFGIVIEGDGAALGLARLAPSFSQGKAPRSSKASQQSGDQGRAKTTGNCAKRDDCNESCALVSPVVGAQFIAPSPVRSSAGVMGVMDHAPTAGPRGSPIIGGDLKDLRHLALRGGRVVLSDPAVACESSFADHPHEAWQQGDRGVEDKHKPTPGKRRHCEQGFDLALELGESGRRSQDHDRVARPILEVFSRMARLQAWRAFGVDLHEHVGGPVLKLLRNREGAFVHSVCFLCGIHAISPSLAGALASMRTLFPGIAL